MSTCSQSKKNLVPEGRWTQVLTEEGKGTGSVANKQHMLGQVTSLKNSTPCCCAAVFVLTFILLLVLCPPMVMKQSRVPHETPQVSVVAVACWSLCAAIGTFVVSVAVK